MALLKPRPKSAARDKLDGAIKARAAVAAKMAALTASVARLVQQIEAVGPAEAALARFDAAQSARLATWAQGGEADVPEADWAQREKLERELAAARATAASAVAAKAGLEAEYTSKANELPPIEMWTRATIAEIVADENSSAGRGRYEDRRGTDRRAATAYCGRRPNKGNLPKPATRRGRRVGELGNGQGLEGHERRA